LYYYDLINNINGFNFSLGCDSLIKINDNLKVFLNRIKDELTSKALKIEPFKLLLASGLLLEKKQTNGKEEDK